MLAGKYVDENSSAAIVGAKRSAGVAPEANLRILLCAFNKACKKGIHSGFETQDRYH